jgi:hypothetical protein
MSTCAYAYAAHTSIGMRVDMCAVLAALCCVTHYLCTVYTAQHSFWYAYAHRLDRKFPRDHRIEHFLSRENAPAPPA